MNAAGGHVVLTQADELTAKCSVLVRIEDVYAHHARVMAAGAGIRCGDAAEPPLWRAPVHGDRLRGHAWTFSQSVENVAPESWAEPAAGFKACDRPGRRKRSAPPRSHHRQTASRNGTDRQTVADRPAGKVVLVEVEELRIEA